MRQAKNFDFTKVRLAGQISRGPNNRKKSKTLRELAESVRSKKKAARPGRPERAA